MSGQKPSNSAESGSAKPRAAGNPDIGKNPTTRPVPLREQCDDLIAVGKLDPERLEPASFAPQRPAAIRRNAETEDLLNGMIAEMHYYMRALVLPSACEAIDAGRRIHFIETAGRLALNGASVADSIAKLRVIAMASEEQRGQIIEAIARAG